MSCAIFRAMLLGLVRDRGALAMSFVLPIAFFVIFASIFAGASGEELRLKLAVADEVRSETSQRLLEALVAGSAVVPVGSDRQSSDQVREMVRRGTADIGLIVRADGEPLDSMGGFGPAPLVIVSDPARGAAVPMLAGQVQTAYFSALPDVALTSIVSLIEDQFLEFDSTQREQLSTGVEDLKQEALEGGSAGWGFQDLFEREDVAGQGASANHVAYYAGAVAMLFLLFSSVHGAISLLEESESGILDRILSGAGSTTVLINGKLIFLSVQGFVQVSIIFVVAWVVYGVNLPGHFLAWSITTAAAAAAAGGIALAIASACSTRRQAQTLANVAILILSALGGSMVPRFLMPPLLQDLGWITPNTWALEAYTSIFWRDEAISQLILPWAMLVAAALLGLLVAQRLARRLQSL